MKRTAIAVGGIAIVIIGIFSYIKSREPEVQEAGTLHYALFTEKDSRTTARIEKNTEVVIQLPSPPYQAERVAMSDPNRVFATSSIEVYSGYLVISGLVEHEGRIAIEVPSASSTFSITIEHQSSH